MKKTQKALVVMSLLVAVMMTGASLATMQDNRNQNGNGNMSSNRGGQNRNSNRGNSNMHGNMNMSGGSMNSNMSMGSGTSGSMGAVSDSDFAMMAAQGGIAEVQMAQLATTKATSKGAQKYAKDMIKDHTKANNNLMKIASKKQMTLPTTPNEEQMQMMQQLQSASGAEFDRMYIEMAGVMAHQKMQGLFQSYINSATDADLKSFATKTLPVVQKHLRMAQDMANGGMSNGNMNMNSNRSGNSNGNMNR